MTEPATLDRAYRVRLRLKPEQERTLSRLLGAKRLVYNWALRRKREAWESDGTKLNGNALSRELTQLMKQPEFAWMKELPGTAYRQVLRDFDRAWANFFAGRGKRPRRKKRGSVDSVRLQLDTRHALVTPPAMVERKDGTQRQARHGLVRLPRIGAVAYRHTEAMPGTFTAITIRRDSAGRWFGSLTANGVPARPAPMPDTDVVGVDLGLKDAAALSTGEVVAAPKYLAAKLVKLRRYQRSYSRQRDAAARAAGLDPARPLPRGTRLAESNRARKRRRQIGRLHGSIADARRDHQHQLTRRIVDGAQVIAIEDLAVKAMARGMGRRAFRRGVADAGLGEIRRQLTYKAAWAGRTLVVVDRFYPSSKTCSGCGEVNTDLALKDRQWSCGACGAAHHRDLNAAKNIAAEGLRLLSTPGNGGINARGEGACAAGRSSPAGQPTSTNRELIYPAAKPRQTRRARKERDRRVEG